MDTAELLEKVRRIDIKIRGLTRDLFAGGYHSAFKGRGMSFSEVRAYQFGDDIRSIDWNVTARTGDPFIKIYEEERELTVMLVADISGSSFFGTKGRSKIELLAEICAVLAFSAASNNDKVGLLLFSNGPDLFLPPKDGRQHTLRILREILNAEPANRRTDLAESLRYLNNVMKKRTVCFILSDFISEGYEKALKVFARRHDVTGMYLFDDHEENLPDLGILPIEDPETGQQLWVDTSSENFRQTIGQRFERNMRHVQQSFLKSGGGFLPINTQDDYVKALLRYFEKRSH